MSSLIYDLTALFTRNLAIGISRHAAKQAKRAAGRSAREMGDKMHSYKTFKTELQQAIQFIKAAQRDLGVKSLEDLTREHVYWYIVGRQDMVQKEELSPNTLSSTVTGIRRLAHLLKQEGVTSELILPDDYQVPRSFSPRGAYTPIEARTIIDYVGKVDALAATVLLMQRFAGLRLHEAINIHVGLAWDRDGNVIPGVDFDAGTVTVKGKGGRVRTVKMLDTAPLARLDRSCSVPLSRGLEKTWSGRIEELVRSACNKHRIQKRGTHGFRATAANHMFALLRMQENSEGHARFQVSKFLGHNRTDVLTHYLDDRVTSLFEADLRDFIE